MNENKTKSGVAERHGQIAMWAAAVFSLLGLAIFLFELITVYSTQKGIFYLGDQVFTPLSAILMGVSLYSYIVLRHGRHTLGTWLLYVMMIVIPSIAIVFILRDFTLVAEAYLVIMASFMIWLVLPAKSRRLAAIVAFVTLLLLIGIDRWNAPFRVRIGDASGIVTAILGLGAVGLVAFLVRRAYAGNILTKLVVAIVLMIVLGVGINTGLSLRAFQASLTDEIGSDLANRSLNSSVLLATAVGQNLTALRSLATSNDIQNAAKAANGKYVQLADIDKLDKQWIVDVPAGNDNNDNLTIAGVLQHPISSLLQVFQTEYKQYVELSLTGIQGYQIASTTLTPTYLQSNQDWWLSAYQTGQYIGQPVLNASNKTITIKMAVLVKENGTGKSLGVLSTTISFASLGDALTADLFGRTGRTVVLLPNGQEFKLQTNAGGATEMVEDAAPPELVAISSSTIKYQLASLNSVPVLASFTGLRQQGMASADTQAILNLNWIVVTLQDQSEALQPITDQTNYAIILGLIIIVLGGIAAFVMARLISDPITRLNAVALKVAEGDLSATAQVETQDEVGTLANTFNSMVTQLRDMVGSLEERVADRTKALTTSTEVSRSLATILDPRQLALEVVEQVQTAFNYYHAHIYFKDEASGDLVMVGGTGQAGAAMLARGHRVPKGRGLVGRAAETNSAVLIPDVSQEPGWLPNALLPETKSEIAIPISSGNQILGVLDVQQNSVNGLDEQDVQLLQSLAGQIAISLQNARSFEQTRAQAELDSMVNTIGEKIQRTGTVEEALQVAIRELGQAIGATRVSASIVSGSSQVDPMKSAEVQHA